MLSLLPVLRQQLHVLSTCVSRSREGPRFKCWFQAEGTGCQSVPAAERLPYPTTLGLIYLFERRVLCCSVLLRKALRNHSWALLLAVNLTGKGRSLSLQFCASSLSLVKSIWKLMVCTSLFFQAWCNSIFKCLIFKCPGWIPWWGLPFSWRMLTWVPFLMSKIQTSLQHLVQY